MAKKTKTQKIIEYLEEKGYVEDPKDRSKYRAFTDPNKPGYKYFVGKRGALRHGKCATKSISITDAINKRIGWKKNTKKTINTKKSIETSEGSVAKFTGNCDGHGNPLYFDGLTVWSVDKDGEIHRIVN